jgi:hypothetical protein
MVVSRRGACLGVALITALALLMRVHGIGFGLPHATFSDGRVLIDQVAALRAGEPDPEGHRLYPHLVPHVAAWMPPPAEGPAAGGLEVHLARAALPFLQARLASVLLSLTLVPATYLLARAVLGRGWSLVATGLVATSLLHVSFAQQERPHGALAGLTAAAVVAALRLRNRPTPGTYVAAGALAARALGAHHTRLAVLPPHAAAHLQRRRERATAGAARLTATVLLIGLAVPRI